MKKLAFMAAAFIAIGLTSCGNNNKTFTPEAEIDEVTIAVIADTVAPDSVVLDTIVGISGTILGDE